MSNQQPKPKARTRSRAGSVIPIIPGDGLFRPLIRLQSMISTYWQGYNHNGLRYNPPVRCRSMTKSPETRSLTLLCWLDAYNLTEEDALSEALIARLD
jgi:hypothetical protein